MIAERRERVVEWDQNELLQKGVHVDWYFCTPGVYSESIPVVVRLWYKEKSMICQVYFPPTHAEFFTQEEVLYYVLERYSQGIDSYTHYVGYLIERYGEHAFDRHVVRAHRAFCHRLETFLSEE